jgi:hypothetical protein
MLDALSAKEKLPLVQEEEWANRPPTPTRANSKIELYQKTTTRTFKGYQIV